MMRKLALGCSALVQLAGEDPHLLDAVVRQTYRAVMGRTAYSTPAVRYHEGVLHVAARSAAWRRALEHQTAEVISTLNAALGGRIVERVAFAPWPKRERAARNPPEGGSQPAPSGELFEIAERIGNMELRTAFLRFGAAVEKHRGSVDMKSGKHQNTE